MNTTTTAIAGSRSATNGRATSLTTTAEQRVRTLAPTVFCPSTEIEQCIERAEARRTA